MPQSLLLEKSLWALRLFLLTLLMLFPVLAQATAVVPGLAVAQSALQDLHLALRLVQAAQQTDEPEIKIRFVQQSINILVDAHHSDFDPNVAALGSGVGVRRYLIDLIERRPLEWSEKIRISGTGGTVLDVQRLLTFGLSKALVQVDRAIQAGKIANLTRRAVWAKNQLEVMILALNAAIGSGNNSELGLSYVVQSLNRVAHVHPLVWRCYPADFWQCLLSAQSASE